MRFSIGVWGLLVLLSPGTAPGYAGGNAKDKPVSAQESSTVPATIDHNRVIIDAEVAGPNGSRQKVRAWVDNGNAELELSRRLATALGLTVSCDATSCSAPAPAAITIGEIKIPLSEVKQAQIPSRPVSGAAVLDPGVNAEINIPSRVLRRYDMLVDFPGHKFSIGSPGTIPFRGSSSKVLVNPENGLIQIPSQLEKRKLNLGLDLGSSISFLADGAFTTLAASHPDWPQMTGAVGPANLWGLDDEPKWKLMRLDRLQYGPLFLTNVAVIDFPKDRAEFFEKRAGLATGGLLGSQALLNYRVGVSYARSLVYFEIGRTFNFPDFDVVGLVLRPQDDGQFTILGVAEFEGNPSVPTGEDGVQPGDHLVAVNDIALRGATMGQVWSMLGGTPGQERKLIVERAGKKFTVAAQVQHFLGELPDEKDSRKKK
jgi:hypothetical protein